MSKIKIGIIGVGNCASSLVQALKYYSENEAESGLMMPNIGDYVPKDIEVVCAFDVDERKVGKNLNEAIYAAPNCTMDLCHVNKDEFLILVHSSPRLDGVSDHMLKEHENYSFRPVPHNQELTPEEIVNIVNKSGVDILINYLPVGSQQATEFWAQVCIETGVSFLNCIPVFIASNPQWEYKFIQAGIPLIGDDMKSEFGASILSQVLQELAFARGHRVKAHIQRNVGGNTDFLNMENKDRLSSKKISKENVIKSQNTIRGLSTQGSFLHAGPSEYIRYYGDNKVANFRLELEGLMGSPVVLDAQLSVQDSPNSAGVVIDAIRYLKVARELGIVGALRGPSAFTQKTPPLQMTMENAQAECRALSNRELTNVTNQQVQE